VLAGELVEVVSEGRLKARRQLLPYELSDIPPAAWGVRHDLA